MVAMPGFFLQRRTHVATWLLSLAVSAGGQAAETAVHVSFDGPEIRWQSLDAGRTPSILSHEIIRDGVRDRGGAERITVAAPIGQPTLFACSIGRMPVIDEFRTRLWIKTSRPGVQLAARVVLPRSIDPQTNRPVTVLLRGPLAQQPGRWQQLALADAVRLLTNQVHVLRAASTSAIDPREAYVEAIILSIPGEPQGVDVLTDELEVEGVVMDVNGAARPDAASDMSAVRRPALAAPFADRPPQLGPPPEGDRESTLLTGPQPVRTGDSLRDSPQVRMQGSLLLVDGQPFMLRAIEWSGEPLAYLAQRGCNAIMLRDPPTAELLSESVRTNMWVICPPPAADATSAASEDWHQVLAWRLYDPAAQDNPAHYRNWISSLHARDDLPPRPILLAPEREWAGLSEIADIMLACHAQEAVLPAAELSEWLSNCRRAARPGTHCWASIGTQLSESTRVQVAALSGREGAAPGVDADHFEQAVLTAYRRGCRGFVFRSQSPLNAADNATRRRANLLEFANRQLQLLGPWIAGGNVNGEVLSTDGAAVADVISLDRARLLVPARSRSVEDDELPPTRRDDSAAPAVHRQRTAFANCSFVVPAVPESDQLYLVTPSGLRPMGTKRVAGGCLVTFDSLEAGPILITQDAQIIKAVRQRIAEAGPVLIRLSREIALEQADEIAATSRRLAAILLPCPSADELLQTATAELQQANTLTTAGRGEPAMALTRDARQRLREAESRQRQVVAAPAIEFVSDPLAATYACLADQAEFSRTTAGQTRGANLLYGGDFESLTELSEAGWQHFVGDSPGVSPRAEVASGQPQHGHNFLRLAVVAAEGKSAAEPSPASWPTAVQVVSPPIHVATGKLVEITGWVRIRPVLRRPAQLLIADSFGGPELVLRLIAATDWRPFRILRVATSDELRISFELTGPGTADLDAVMVRALEEPLARRLPPLKGDSPTAVLH